jgi:hypothetical protein
MPMVTLARRRPAPQVAKRLSKDPSDVSCIVPVRAESACPPEPRRSDPNQMRISMPGTASPTRGADRPMV